MGRSASWKVAYQAAVIFLIFLIQVFVFISYFDSSSACQERTFFFTCNIQHLLPLASQCWNVEIICRKVHSFLIFLTNDYVYHSLCYVYNNVRLGYVRLGWVTIHFHFFPSFSDPEDFRQRKKWISVFSSMLLLFILFVCLFVCLFIPPCTFCYAPSLKSEK